MAAIWSAQGGSRVGPAHPVAALRRQQQAHPRRPSVQPRAYKGEESSSASAAAAEAQLPPPPEGEVPPAQAMSSFDDGGFEAGVMPQVDQAALSSEDEYMEMAANYGANACPLPPACPMPGELERLEVKQEYLESVDGMVGNYEFAIEEKKQELGDATDDLQRIMAELAALEEAAGINRSAAGGGGAASSDYCEGAEVSELE